MRLLALALLLVPLALSAAEAPSPADVLPFRSLFSRDELASGFDRQRIHPLGEREIYFDVVVPKSWRAHPVSLTQEQIIEDHKRLVGLTRLTPPDREDVSISVAYVRAPGDDAAKKAVELAATSRGARILTAQRGDFSGRSVEDALLAEAGSTNERWLRATASRHGELVFVVLGEAPRGDYEAFKRVFGAAAVSLAVGEGTIRRDYDPRRMTF
jgi:hypothetical protein